MSAPAKAVARLFTETVFELPLARDYCGRWGMPEAAREIIQNALDSESPFEYELSETTFRVRSRHSNLAPRTLLLGTTSKSENPAAIGSFGEGYKIAMLVLARVGYRVAIHNGDVEWRPEFRDSKKFGTEILCIVQTAASARHEGLTFEIDGLAQGDADLIRKSCLKLQSEIGEVIEVPQGRILLERPGTLYVGSLFICNTALRFGYDISPQHIRLERDRQTVSDFDLKWIAKDMWFSSGRYEQVAKLIDEEVPDLEHADAGTPELVKEALYKLFCEKHPGHLVARNADEMKALVEKGCTRVVVLGGAGHSIISSYTPYLERPSVRTRTPVEYLQRWLDDHRYHIHADAKRDMVALIERASTWKAP